MTTALVILSGGQDSTTSLFWAKKRWDLIEAITFDYGQRHRIEIESAKKVAEIAGIAHKIVKFSALEQIADNAMIKNEEITINQVTGLPTTFVPGRNLLFVTLAAGYAYGKGIKNLVLGVSQVDYSGYPDCRRETIKSLEKTISLGMDMEFTIYTPLIDIDKKGTVLMAKELGVLDVMKYTHTCYKGEQPPCRECPACKLRAKGFAEAGIIDPLIVNG